MKIWLNELGFEIKEISVSFHV